jgi:protease-4
MKRLALFASVVFLAGCFNGITLCPTNTGAPVEESVMHPAHSCLCCDKIAIIDVDGLILNARTSCLLGDGENPLSLFREKLEAAADDKHVKAVVLRINSPGGAVTASDIMYQDVLKFRHATNKPVVACMMDVAASGGFYLAMAGDVVYAHPTTVTGSIGVIMKLYDASGLFAKIGLASNPIKSGPNKDIGNPGRPMTPAERAILQHMIDQFYCEFVHVVTERRHLPEERVRELADGRIYTGLEAKELGLVDRIGYLEDAIATAMDLACLKDAKIVAYDRCDGYRGSIYAGLPKIPSEINVKLDVPGLGKSGAMFMYLWEPGTLP